MSPGQATAKAVFEKVITQDRRCERAKLPGQHGVGLVREPPNAVMAGLLRDHKIAIELGIPAQLYWRQLGP